MSKRILVLSTNPRIGGNSETLADVFMGGAEKAGHEIKKIYLYDKEVEFCKGCLDCQTAGKCILRGNTERIIAQIEAMDVLVFATPVYFYEMSGQMKILLNHTNPLFPAEYEFRGIHLLATSANEEESSMEAAVKGLEGWIGCFEKSRLASVMRGTGANKEGAVEECGKALSTAYEMGRDVQKEAGAISLMTTMPVAVITFKQ